jgi:hypothetical protein
MSDETPTDFQDVLSLDEIPSLSLDLSFREGVETSQPISDPIIFIFGILGIVALSSIFIVVIRKRRT